ncbi:hypothetical protein AYI68_g7286 [Smittium mucronatum]|uniref:Uncharacterized protein n=1 Tax=Smittium mucronatum TaxID=133383 RepID=A0A1R0GP55_9FUNG|nr:hypothetical protein AYI68_g7286 [Smittium mucronatum]
MVLYCFVSGVVVFMDDDSAYGSSRIGREFQRAQSNSDIYWPGSIDTVGCSNQPHIAYQRSSTEGTGSALDHKPHKGEIALFRVGSPNNPGYVPVLAQHQSQPSCCIDSK